jgi:hypothetical protein
VILKYSRFSSVVCCVIDRAVGNYRRGNAVTGLSSVVVGQLGVGEQLLLWALRQRHADQGETTPELVQGFLLACGLAGVEPALGCFERLSDALRGDGRCGVGPLRCAVVSDDEARCLALLAAAQRAETWRVERLAVGLVGCGRCGELAAAASHLAEALARAGYRLTTPLRPGPPPRLVH